MNIQDNIIIWSTANSSSVDQTLSYNILDDDVLIKLIKETFNNDDMKLFELNFKYYTYNKNNLDDFIVDFEEIYEWIGFSRKSHAKRLLESKNSENIPIFEINKDYIIKSVLPPKGQKHIGRNKSQILLTIECFKMYCLTAATTQSKKIYKYYIKMETIVTKYIENKHNEIIDNNKKILEEKNKIIEDKNKVIEENIKILELKDNEINNIKNKKYEESEKTGSIYIFTTDKQNIHKCGKSKCVIKRKSQLQTAVVDDIQLIYEYKTTNDTLLESIVHEVFKDYRSKSNREHFWCNTDYMKTIIDIAGITLDTLKSSYEYISKKELLEKLYEKLYEENDIYSNRVVIDENVLNNVVNNNINDLLLENNIDINTDIITADYAADNLNNIHLPVIVRFLEDLIYKNKNNEEIIILSSSLFSLFNDFLLANNILIDYTSTKFGLDIKSYEGFTKKKTNKGIEYIININLVKNNLITKFNLTFNNNNFF